MCAACGDWAESVGSRFGSTLVQQGKPRAVYDGGRFTTIKDRREEIGAGLLAAMLRQLGLSRDDL